LWDYLCDDDNKRAMFRLTWDDLVADLMPRELLIEQLPSTLQRGAQTWRVQYRPVGANLEQVVVVVTDVTLELAAKAAEAERIEHAELLDRIVRDVESFRGFLKEAHALVDELQSNSASSARVLHTLKGNASLIGAQRLAKSCHELEDQIAAGAEVHAADFAALRTSLVALEHRFGVLLGEQAERLRVDIGDVDEVRGLVRGGAAVNAIEAVLDSWSGEPLRVVVDRLADQARALIRRLGRDGEVVVDADALRVPRGGLDAIMTVCSHVVRNAVDHGFESTDECLRFNKTAVPTLRCIAHRNEDAFVIAIADDGCGVDWERLANKARTQGLAHHTHNDLVTALFTDGVSTRDAVTELSGRGVGMAAVREAVERAGGRVDVESQRGRGTTVSLIFPASLLDRPAASRPEVEIHAAA
jgi:two-component system chemotaxis sensor kinase CheA